MHFVHERWMPDLVNQSPVKSWGHESSFLKRGKSGGESSSRKNSPRSLKGHSSFTFCAYLDLRREQRGFDCDNSETWLMPIPLLIELLLNTNCAVEEKQASKRKSSTGMLDSLDIKCAKTTTLSALQFVAHRGLITCNLVTTSPTLRCVQCGQ